MAYGRDKKLALRAAYVFDRLGIELAAKKCKVGLSTAARWKREAAANGDDWEKARGAVAMSEQNFGDLARGLLNDYLLAHQTVMADLRQDQEMTARDRVEAIAALSDAFNKTMASFRRVAPEISKHAVAIDVLQALTDFIKSEHPQHLDAFARILEPFGARLSRILA
jgi:hypothetical protein